MPKTYEVLREAASRLERAGAGIGGIYFDPFFSCLAVKDAAVALNVDGVTSDSDYFDVPQVQDYLAHQVRGEAYLGQCAERLSNALLGRFQKLHIADQRAARVAALRESAAFYESLEE
jgi:hypothetical protein